uniref:Uncharacterized protein n=1 Tax=viral metagenome TaxID=1070528 RepID=A0A6C0AD63_9ZZZZ
MDNLILTGSSSDMDRVLKVKFEQDEEILNLMLEVIVPQETKEEYYYNMLCLKKIDEITFDLLKVNYAFNLREAIKYLPKDALFFSELFNAFKFVIADKKLKYNTN